MKALPKGSIYVNRRDIMLSMNAATMPHLNEGEVLVCEGVRFTDMPDFNESFLCEADEDLKSLQEAYGSGWFAQLNWYATTEICRILSPEEFSQMVQENQVSDE